MNKLVDEAPYHPGYEDAVVPPNRVYSGVKTGKMLWKPKPLNDQEIDDISDEVSNHIDTYAGRREFARAIEKRHGIK